MPCRYGRSTPTLPPFASGVSFTILSGPVAGVRPGRVRFRRTRMLKALRENFKHLQWILWAVIAVFVIFVFADWGMGSQRGGAGDAALAAKAGDIRITTADFQREYAFAEDRYRQAYGKNFTPELARAMNLPEQVLNSI